MPKKIKDEPDGVAGFRVNSGRAVVVLVGGRREKPRILARTAIALSTKVVEGSAQPYHASTGKLETDEKLIATRIAAVRRTTENSVSALLRDWTASGWIVHFAALVVGSLKLPDDIANQHIRAHALEGQLFRTVLEESLLANFVEPEVISHKKVYHEAAHVLRQNVSDLRKALTALGDPFGSPWQADHKLATAAAWMLLT